MDVLIRYGFTIEEIKSMMDSNNQIESASDKSICELIDLLGNVGCLSNHIKNIFLCNPFYLSRNIQEVKNLIEKLYNLGFNNLYVLFDTNPYILNLNSYELEEIFNTKRKEGLSEEETIDYINYNVII